MINVLFWIVCVLIWEIVGFKMNQFSNKLIFMPMHHVQQEIVEQEVDAAMDNVAHGNLWIELAVCAFSWAIWPIELLASIIVSGIYVVKNNRM